jgi:hypothetical protein
MLGEAAVAIWCDVAADVKDEFDDWHVHEHSPERLTIPGFLRGSRWVSVDGCNSYFIVYELEELAVLTAGPYLERLNNPTPWSRKMMPNHRNMMRSLCRVRSSFGAGLGEAMLTVRFSPQAGAQDKLERWLNSDLLPALPARKGLCAAHLLRDAGQAQGAPTTEQKIRGGDKTADWIVLVKGYSTDALERLAAEELSEAALDAHRAAPGSIARIYRLAYTLTAADLGNAP